MVNYAILHFNLINLLLLNNVSSCTGDAAYTKNQKVFLVSVDT